MSQQIVRTGFVSTTLAPSLTEVSRVFKHIRRALEELDTHARSASTMENELYAFELTYYERVMPLTARLERLRYRKLHGVFPKVQILPEVPAREQNLMEKRRKAIFRALAKRCHPDSSDANAPVSIEEVLAANTLGALWLLEIRCLCDRMDDNETLLPFLETQRADIGLLLKQARSYITVLKQGDLWLLKERVCEAALEGVDLIEAIQGRIELQIAALQQYFVKPKEFRAAA